MTGRPSDPGTKRRSVELSSLTVPEDDTRALEREARLSGHRNVARGVVIQTAFPGDVILTTPLIRRAAERLGAPVDVVTTPAAAPVLANNPHIRDVVVFDKKDTDGGLRGLWRMIAKLRARQYAVAYLAQTSPRTAILAWGARIPRRIGFRDAKGGWLYTHAVMGREPHQVERLLKLADGAPERREPEIFPSAGDREAVAGLLQESGIGRGEFVALAPGAHWATKRWPYFPELAQALAAEGVALALVGGPGDRADAQ